MNDALSSWVPASVLVGALTVVCALLFALLKTIAKKLTDQLTTLQQSVTSIEKSNMLAATVSHVTAVSDELKARQANMGERFDERVRVATERIAVLESQVRALEARQK
jgi:hypothetical protein